MYSRTSRQITRQLRQYSVQPRKKPILRDLISGPVFKSLVLTLVFGSVVVNATGSRKEMELLQAAYEAKFRILEDITRKVRNKEPVDVAQELKIANSITRHKYNSVTDVELDEQFEAFLMMAEEPEDPTEVLVKSNPLPEIKERPSSGYI